MTPGQIQGSIDEICEGLEHQRSVMILMKGSDRTQQPFKIEFDPRVQSYEEMMQILETVRSRFPQWRIVGEWKQ
jgi:uncharacterized lipoprotein YmbA